MSSLPSAMSSLGFAGARAPAVRITARANARRPSAIRRHFLAASPAGLRASRPIRVVTSQGERETRTGAYEGGNGGNGDGNDGGDNGWGRDGEGDDDSSGFSGNAWLLLTAAVGALGLFGAYQKLQKKSDAAKLSEDLDTDDVSTLKRLLREAFADLVKVCARLDELETVTGVSSSDLSPDGTPLDADASRKGSHAQASPRGGSSVLSGSLKIGGGLLWEDDPSAGGLGAVADAGVRLGTDLILRVGGPVRGGKDAVVAEVRVDPGEEQFALQKILYSARLAPGLRAVLAPFGARGQDVAYTLNPLAGQGLTSTVKHGSPLHRQVLGSVLGLAADLRRAWLSVALFSEKNDEGEPLDVVMAQAVVAPIPALSLGLTVLEPREAVAAALFPAGSVAPSEAETPMPTPRLSARGPVPSTGALSAAGGAGPPRRQLGATAALAAGNMALHAWAATDGDAVQAQAWHRVQWGASIGPQGDGSGSGWCVGVGRVDAAGRGVRSVDPAQALAPNLLEVSTQISLGDGMLLTPGVVVLRRGGQHTVFAGIKTAWMF